MRILQTTFVVMCVVAIAATSAPSAVADHRDLGREVLAPNDGWASFGAGTTGGSAAAPEQVYFVDTRAELIAALNNGVPSPTSPSNPSSAPKIIYVDGTIDFNVDDDNQPLGCVDYYRNGFTIEAFLATYDPGGVGPGAAERPAGGRLASLRGTRSRRACGSAPGSNTTIVGLGKKARLRGVWLDIRGSSTVNVTNIIIRNLTFQDTFDCFPAWAPTDGALGVVERPVRFHFAAQRRPRVGRPQYLRGPRNRRRDPAAVLRRAVPGARRAARHHQRLRLRDRLLEPLPQPRQADAHRLVRQRPRRPRQAARDAPPQPVRRHRPARPARSLRAGARVQQLLQDRAAARPTGIRWGVGIESAIYAENNFFKTDKTVTPDQFISRLNGTAIFEAGTQRERHTGDQPRRRGGGLERRERSGSRRNRGLDADVVPRNTTYEEGTFERSERRRAVRVASVRGR